MKEMAQISASKTNDSGALIFEVKGDFSYLPPNDNYKRAGRYPHPACPLSLDGRNNSI